MKRLIAITLLAAALSWSGQAARPCFAQSQAVNYLVEIGIKYYNNGAYSDALHEFKKALLVDPQNPVALEYLQKIDEGHPTAEAPLPVSYTAPTRDQLIARTLDSLEQPKKEKEEYAAYTPSYGPSFAPAAHAVQSYTPPEELSGKGPLHVSGEIQASFGYEDGELIGKRANYDLNEKNWRILSTDALNRKENTFDPAIYDRLKLNIDTDHTQDGFGFHTGIFIDPWTFTGTSDQVTLTGAGGDSARVQLKYWSNTSSILNETVYTLANGDSFNLPEIKVKDGKTVPTTITTTWGNIITIPEMKIHREFQPVRELWFDYKQDDSFKLTVFPLALSDKAYTSDDPLRLSNNHMYWEDSPWLRSWKTGNYNSGAAPVSFRKGYWDDSISFSVKDSGGARLTALRGFSLDARPADGTHLTTTWASPKTLWQDYSDADNISGATRIVQSAADNLKFGATHTMRLGLTEDERKVDMRNHVFGIDSTYEPVEGTKFSAEVAASQSQYDLTSPAFKTKARGNAYLFSAITRYPGRPIIDTDYDAIQSAPGEPYTSKLRLLAVHMDQGFDPALSSYRATRQDQPWSRHIHFRRPFDYFSQDFYGPSMKLEDIEPFAIGTGVDVGRDVVGLRWQATWDKKVDNLFDIRNVHTVNGKYVETVTRDEVTWLVNDRLTAKALGLYQDMPRTKGGIDPFLYDARTGEYLTDWSSDPIDDGKDPSLKTGSLGLEYELTDRITVNGIYEYTNDYSLAYGNFPRGNLNSAQPSLVYQEYGNTYLRDRVFLYDQQYFPQPPYPFYNVFKLGAKIVPVDKIEVYLDYTRNEFEKAGQISDSMNHIGLEISYLPTDRLGLYLRYCYSRWDDLDRVIQGITESVGHHNVFLAARYRGTNDDEFVLEYGVSPNIPLVASSTYDPYGGSLATIDTQHMIRFYYRRKF